MFHENAGKEERKASFSSPRLSIPSINLPKYDGFVHGIIEQAAAGPVTGAGSLPVSIAVCTGRSVFGIQSKILFDSDSGKGTLNIGWNLPLSSFTHMIEKGFHKYESTHDHSHLSHVY
jgi:hypothetical protein